MEVRRRPDGLVVVNDAYNANPESMSAALRALVVMSARSGSVGGWAVLGEMLELGPDAVAEHAAIGRLVAELGLVGLVTVGSGALPIAAAARAAGGVRVLTADGVDEALALVQQNVRRGDVVLIKASRSIGLERLAESLLTDPDSAAPDSGEPDSGETEPAPPAIPRIDALSGRPERKESR
jgi:UDP-N-acetylmuramoyl-tripeptide--D-alanyl-D-alanine ligase